MIHAYMDRVSLSARCDRYDEVDVIGCSIAWQSVVEGTPVGACATGMAGA